MVLENRKKVEGGNAIGRVIEKKAHRRKVHENIEVFMADFVL